MKVFILLSLACLAVSLPIHAGTQQADLNLPDSVYESGNKENSIPFTQRIKAHPALADPTSLPAPTAATPSNAALFRRWRPRVWLNRFLTGGPKRLPPRGKPSNTLSEELSKDHLALADPASLPAPTAATPSNATLFQRRGLGVMLSPYRRPYRHYRFRPRVKPPTTLSKEPSKDHLAQAGPTSLPAPTATTSSNAALFRRSWLGIWLIRGKPRPPPA